MQITEQQQIAWEDFSRGFHGGRIDSEEIETFNFPCNKQYVSFSVREYTSDHEDFFGVACPMWEIFVWICDVTKFQDKLDTDYKTEVLYRAGDDYCKAEYAQEFCEYILYSIKKHGNLSRLPVSERVED